jgi:hypothetical protein
MASQGRTARVFVSYAHERKIDGHRDRALNLAQSLRLRGVEAFIDQFVEHDPPTWPRWMLNEIKVADYVLCLASPTYKERAEGRGDLDIGRGARWEGAVITEQLYGGFPTAQEKFIAVVLERCFPGDIPDLLLPVGRSYYLWPQDDEDLYRRLTGQPRILPAPLGEIVQLPTRLMN